MHLHGTSRFSGQYISVNTPWYLSATKYSMDGFCYAATLLCDVIGAASVKFEDTRLMTIFVTLYHVDAMFNLLRTETGSICQVLHFLIQMVICYIMRLHRGSFMPTWKKMAGTPVEEQGNRPARQQ